MPLKSLFHKIDIKVKPVIGLIQLGDWFYNNLVYIETILETRENYFS